MKALFIATLLFLVAPQLLHSSIRLRGIGGGTMWEPTTQNNFSVTILDGATGENITTDLEMTSTVGDVLGFNGTQRWLHVNGDNAETSQEGNYIQDTESMIFTFSVPVDLVQVDVRFVLTDGINKTGANGKMVLISNAFTELTNSDLTLQTNTVDFTTYKGADNEIIVENMTGFAQSSGTLLSLPEGVLINTDDSFTITFRGTVEGDINQGGQIDWFDVTHVQIEPEIPGLLYGYFDIPVGSTEGDVVTGRINPKANRNVDRTPINPNSEFAITGGTGAGLFEMETEWDQFGHMFGIIKVASGQTLSAGEFTLDVDYIQDATIKESIQLTVNVVRETQWESFAERAIHHSKQQSRMWGRTDVSESEVTTLIPQLIASGGILPDKNYTDFNNGMIDICNYIGGFSRNLVLSSKYGPNGTPEDQASLREALYHVYIYLYSQFPVVGFSENGSVIWNNRTHQWRYTDPLAGSAMYALSSGWMDDMASPDAELAALATDAWEKVVNFLEINWEAPSSERAIPEDTVRYAGFWADANRHHRMRSWCSAVALTKDYNQPVTYSSHWYPYTDGPLAGFSLLPGWEPSGSFFDLKTWLDTNFTPSYFYWLTDRASGFLPDGSVSHHTGVGQDIALWAYGYEWMMTTTTEVAGWFKNTPWEIQDGFWNTASEYVTYTIGNVLYENSHDMAFIGRSHNSSSVGTFGTGTLRDDLLMLMNSKPDHLTLSKEAEVETLIDTIASGTHQRALNVPFWNADAMVHRRGGDSEAPFYMSLKMISERTRGAEGFFDDVHSHHMAHGFFQLKVRGDEYDEARYNWDWHVLPGTTVEWRTDDMPIMNSKNDFSAAKNAYAGVVSDGNIGAASFIFDHTNEPYTTSTSKKSYFFLEDMAVMVGSDIERTSAGQGLPIVTTVDQASWFSDISYNANGSGMQTIAHGSDADLSLNLTSVSWFHQGESGYVIWPYPESGFSDVVIRTGANINDSDTTRATSTPVFHVAINHGTDPVAATSGYVYAVVPNVTAGEMDALAANFDQQLSVNIEPDYHSVTDSGTSVTQATFFNAATIDLPGSVDLTVDQPAMVILENLAGGWAIALSEPNKASDIPVINVSLTTELESGAYPYQTMGVWNSPAESVTVTSASGTTTLAFNLPDVSDEILYENRHEVYYGMPASIVVPSSLDPFLEDLWGSNLLDWEDSWLYIEWLEWIYHYPESEWFYSPDNGWLYILRADDSYNTYFMYDAESKWMYLDTQYLPLVYYYELGQWVDTSV